jgi:hypothetical protein
MQMEWLLFISEFVDKFIAQRPDFSTTAIEKEKPHLC